MVTLGVLHAGTAPNEIEQQGRGELTNEATDKESRQIDQIGLARSTQLFLGKLPASGDCKTRKGRTYSRPRECG